MTQDFTTVAGEVAVAVQTFAPILPPNIGIAVTVASKLLSAVLQAQNSGLDITDEQLLALFARDDAAKVADLVAQNAAI